MSSFSLQSPADPPSPAPTPTGAAAGHDALVLAPDPAKPLRLDYGDAVRVVGTLAVVVGHVCDLRLFSGKPLTAEWWVCNFWDSAARWAVPAYIMLSGALLLDPARAESPRKFYTKRLARIGAPLAFWSLFFMAFDVYYTGWRAPFPPDPAYEAAGRYLWPAHTAGQWVAYFAFLKPKAAWLNLLYGKPYMHLHFIFRIAGLYAFTPMFRVFLRHCTRPMLVGTVGILLGLWSLDCVMSNITGTELTAFARWAPFVGYYLAGYLLRQQTISRKGLAWCWVIAVACVLALALGTALTMYLFHDWQTPGAPVKGPPSLEMMLYDFLSPVRVVMAVVVWLIVVNAKLPPGREGAHHPIKAAIHRIAPTTLGLYLIHPMFREMLYTARLPFLGRGLAPVLTPDKPWTVWVGIPLMAVCVYVPSLLAVRLMMKIPLLRRVVA